MIKFKECPRCQGDLDFAKDAFGEVLSCMQCGYLHDLEAGVLMSEPVPATSSEQEQDAA